MRSSLPILKRIASFSLLVAVVPFLVVCSGDKTTDTKGPPANVEDLMVSGVASTSVTLSFTEVDDGSGAAANYEVRYAVAPISWGNASPATSGTCTSPLSGSAIGNRLTCSILGLTPATAYNFQLIAFRGSLNQDAVFGGQSNVASASTPDLPAPPPPPPPPPPPTPTVTTVTVAPSSASIVAGATTSLQAIVKDADGNVMTGQSITWSSSNTAVATVSSSGVVTGVAAGSATITATCSGKSGTAAITVTSPAPVVTTVTVAPQGPSINVGATVTLVATVKDAQGNVMTGQTITWSSANTSIATVSTGGVVTGVAAGSATITATCSGKSGSSTVSVTAPPPPPPGGTILFQEDFEDGNIGARGWYDNTSAQISTTEHASGSTASAQYHFLAGANTPTSGGAQRHKFTPSNSLYVSFYVKYSTNWVGSGQAYHPHEFYVLSTLDGDYDGPSQNFLDVYIEHNYQNGGRPRLAMQDNKSVNTTKGALPNNLIGVTEDRSTGGCNGVAESNIFSECYNAGTYWYNDKQLTGPVVFQPNPGTGYKSNWNFVEAYFQLNTIVNGVGQADGVMQYWFNGTLIIDRHDIMFRTGAHPTLQFSQFLIAPYIGDGSPADQYMWLDNLRVATARIP